MKDFEALVALFHKHGGKFKNTELKYQDDLGFYCCTLNSNKNSVISCPDNLLVDCEDIDINENGLYISNTEKYKNEIEFLEKYFLFHFGKRTIDYFVNKKKILSSLTEREISYISKLYPHSMFNTDGKSDLDFAKEQILISHKITHLEKHVLMPFTTFLNYNENGKKFGVKKKEIVVSEKFENEVYALYNRFDSIMLAGGYGFSTKTKYAYSLPTTLSSPDGIQIHINSAPNFSNNTNSKQRTPLIKTSPGNIMISWFPLHFEGIPAFPAKTAKLIENETGLAAEWLLYEIFRFNISSLVSVAFNLHESKNPYAKMVADASRKQLEVIGKT